MNGYDGANRILNLMEKHGAKNNPNGIYIAKVVSPPPNLVIVTGDLQIEDEDIIIADYLLPQYTRQATVSNISGALVMTDTPLKKDDTVVVMPTADNQTWIVLCKGVSADG